MYTTDTHGLLWYLQEASASGSRRPPKGLSPRARRVFSLADEGREIILIPSIVLVESVYLTERNFVPAALVDQLMAYLGRSPENYRLVPLDLDIVKQLREIPATTHSRLLSRDQAFSDIPGVHVVW